MAYIIIILTMVFSYILYKKFQEDMSLQDINAIKIEINNIISRIKNSKNDTEKELLKQRINKLQRQINE